MIFTTPDLPANVMLCFASLLKENDHLLSRTTKDAMKMVV